MCAVRNCLEARLRDFLPSEEVLFQMYTNPAPHHHFTYPLPKPASPKPSSAALPPPAASTGSADLADASSADVTAAVSSQTRRQSLSMFHFYGMLRHKAEAIQILANLKGDTSMDKRPSLTEECMAFMERLKLLPVNLQRLVLGLQPSMANYAAGFMVRPLEPPVLI